MDEDLKTLIGEVAELLDENGRTSFEHANRVETLLAIIIDKLEFPRRKYGLSETTFERTLRKVIGQVDSEDDIESTFQDLLGELKKELGTSEGDEYSVAFHLPIELPGTKTQYELTVHGVNIEQLSKEVWKEEFLETAQKDVSFGIRLKESPYESPDKGSFWKVNISAIDPDFAVERTNFVLQTFLAELNYLNHYGRITNIETPTSNPWPRSWSDIVLPFSLLVFNDEEFVKAEFSEDARPRNPVEINQEVLDRIDGLPSFSEEKYETDSHLISGLHFFLAGVTNTDNVGAFLDFWRGLETLTLSEPGDSSNDITDRATTIIRPDDEHLFKEHIDRIVATRNNLVHGNTDVDVVQADLNALKQLLESLIDLYIYRRGEWNESDIRFVLQDCNLGEQESLQQQREARVSAQEEVERELEILDGLIEGDE